MSQNMMKVIEHEHPLKLIDLQVNVEDVEESDEEEEEEEEKDVVTQDEFSCNCNRCDQVINEYYRYYYKCIDDSCKFSLHKFCAEVPKTLKHISHPHTLELVHYPYSFSCYNCGSRQNFEVCYRCYFCYMFIDVNCCVEVEKRKIYHPSHPHPLVSLISNPILCYCKACGNTHKGVFFLCMTCPNFTIHTDCAFLPKSLLIQTSNDNFHHTHPLTLSYSFPRQEQEAKYNPRCRVCDGRFTYSEDLWVYKCEKCLYYAHVDCAASRRESFMSILSIGIGPTVKNFKDVDYPKLFRLPFPDQTHSIPKQLFFKKLGPIAYGTNEVSLEHINHQHELILVDTECIGSTSSMNNSLIMCHNPMKKIELLCNGCVKPIMETPFYKCGASEYENCNFTLHEWCTRLPTKVDDHPGHPQHTLVLMSNVSCMFLNTFYCGACYFPCNGFAYGCVKCKYYVDVSCAFMPENITHKSHPDHLLSMVKVPINISCCHICKMFVAFRYLYPLPYPSSFEGSIPYTLSFSCKICDVYIHLECASLLPETIRHICDKHPMHLCYLPVENHKSEYFCEICENELSPDVSFYHCDVCAQSVHSACAPLTLQWEKYTYSSYYRNNVYWFLNVKFGSIHKIDDHPCHPLSFAQGIEADGECSKCGRSLRYEMILKCLECQFAIHCECCKDFNNS